MNLIALMPVKNEAWVLRASAEIALQYSDGIVILDHGSTDGTSEILDELWKKYSPEDRIRILHSTDEQWNEMNHRQQMLEAARLWEATHIAIVDADEILTSNLLGSIRDWISRLEPGQILALPLYNLRGSLNHFHESGIWGNRQVSFAFRDHPALHWSGDQFHHREPMGLELEAVRIVKQGEGGVMHLWGADLRRLAAKHALYKMTERVRWPEKSLSEIEAMYNLWRGPTTTDPMWRIAQIPSSWWQAYEHSISGIHLNEVPWQEEACRELARRYGTFTFKGLDLFGCAEAPIEITGPIFSLCHTTARLDGWQKAASAWYRKCSEPERVEYILSVDEGTDLSSLAELPSFGKTRVVVNTKRRCSVDGWNRAAQASTGRFLINVADDIMPCEHWDSELLRAIPNLKQDVVLDIDTGGAPGLLPFSFLSRKYIEKLTDRYGYEGGFFYPGYRGMYCDTEFTDLARRDGVVINARHLYFEHQHPFFNKGTLDAIYERQNSKDEYAYGKAMYDQRMIELNMTGIANEVRKFAMTICLPGETFNHRWVAQWTELYAFLSVNYTLLPIFSYCSNVYVNRMTMLRAILEYPAQTHLVLWIDDDNLVSFNQIEQLIRDLNEHPEADGVAGWCWINRGIEKEEWGTSCGRFDEDGIGHSFTHDQLMEGSSDLKEIDFTGFPVVLFRRGALDKVGPAAFRPWLSDVHPWGFAGEDLSFCHAAKAGGCRLFVDRRVRVRHLKLRDDTPPVTEKSELESRPAGA
jgi:glycosyltransferase involved in cell wall biosynthesis